MVDVKYIKWALWIFYGLPALTAGAHLTIYLRAFAVLGYFPSYNYPDSLLGFNTNALVCSLGLVASYISLPLAVVGAVVLYKIKFLRTHLFSMPQLTLFVVGWVLLLLLSNYTLEWLWD